MPTSQKSSFRALLESLPLLQYAGTIILAVCGAWTTIQLTQSSHAASIKQNTEDIQSIKVYLVNREDKTVTRELFDERTKAIQEDLRQVKEILNKERR